MKKFLNILQIAICAIIVFGFVAFALADTPHGWPYYKPAPVESVNGIGPDSTTGDIALTNPLAHTDNATRDRRLLNITGSAGPTGATGATGSAAPAYDTVTNLTGTTYTLQASDMGTFITSSNTDNQTITIPNDGSIIIGSHVDIMQLGSGKLKFSTAAGVTLVSLGGYTSSGGRYSGFTARKIAAGTWALFGFLGP